MEHLTGLRPYKKTVPPKQRAVRPNDVYQVADGNNHRLVMVRSVFDTHVIACLAHSCEDWMTDADLVSWEFGFPLVVQFDIQGCLLHEQLLKFIGHLPLGWEEDSYNGLSLIGPLDARWTLKASEGNTLRSMTTQTWLDLTENL